MSSPLNHLLPYIHRFRSTDLDDAPETPGIYAWYSVLAIGPKDWELDIIGGVDRGIERLGQVLARHSSRFSTPPLEVSAIGRFTASWKGRLFSDGVQQMQRSLSTTSQEPSTSSHPPFLSQVLAGPHLRKALVDILGLATPLLSSPLYIGVSDDLRRRLREHAGMLQRCAKVVARDPSARERLLEEDTQFAFRAIGSGLTLENLEVWTLDLSSALAKQYSNQDLRTLAEAAEWLLNRWHRPLHGKR